MNRWHSAVICFCMLPAAVMAQFEKKVSVYIDAGVTASPKSERLNTKGQPTDIFGAYKSGQLVGGAILYSLDDRQALLQFTSNQRGGNGKIQYSPLGQKNISLRVFRGQPVFCFYGAEESYQQLSTAWFHSRHGTCSQYKVYLCGI